uniref:Mitochondrial import inner membrane translocase subunit TIM22 n=1 Tax=Pelagomonas calceolata TaxID=35677 RepID=A0A7S3ZJU0_9STRA
MADTTARPEDVDIGQLGSMFGVQTRNEPDYLEYDIRGRGYMERLFFNCGASYLGFMLGGGVYGTVQGLRLAPANAPLRVRTNALMNGFGKHGATAGNAAGAVALMFTSFESLAESVELDKICGDQAWVNPVAAGALTGGLFKAGAGVRGAALASAIGAGLAAASHFAPERLR